MFCSTPTTESTTEEDDKNQQPPPAFHPDAPLRCARLHQSLPPQPYALEVSNRVREGLVIASRQPQLGGGDGQQWMMMAMTTATVAVDDHGGATPSPPAVPDCRRVCVSLPPGAVGGVRPSGDDQHTGPPADLRCRHRRRRRHRRTTAMGTTT